MTARVETSHEGRWGPGGDEGKPDEVGDGVRVNIGFRGGPSTPSLVKRVRCVGSQVMGGEALESCKRTIGMGSMAET